MQQSSRNDQLRTPKYFTNSSTSYHNRSTATLHQTSFTGVNKTELLSKAMKDSSGMLYKFKDIDFKVAYIAKSKEESMGKIEIQRGKWEILHS